VNGGFALSSNLEEFQKMLFDGWRLEKIQYHFTPVSSQITVKFTKGSETRSILAKDDEPFLGHIIHYHQLPDPKTGQIELRYVQDTEKYFELQKRLFTFICGVEPYFPIFTEKRLPSAEDHNKIEDMIRTWIESESKMYLFPTKMPRLFYDVLVLCKKGSNIECTILEKEKTALSDILKILRESSNTD